MADPPLRWRRLFLVASALSLVTVALGRFLSSRESARVGTRTPARTCRLVIRGQLSKSQTNVSGANFHRAARSVQQHSRISRSVCIDSAGPPVYIRFVDGQEETFNARALSATRTIELSTTFAAAATDSTVGAVLMHELVHLAVADEIGERFVPSWYSEGIAHELSGTVSCEDSVFFALNLELARERGESSLEGSRRALQLLGEDDRAATAMAFTALSKHFKQSGLQGFHRAVRAGGFHSAVESAVGKPASEFLRSWAENVSRTAALREESPPCQARS